MAPSNCCASCHTELPKKDFLCCHICKLKYDLVCANVSRKRFVEMVARQKASFRCPECSRKPTNVSNAKTSLLTCENSDGSPLSMSSQEASPESEPPCSDKVTQRIKPSHGPPSQLPEPELESYVTEDKLRDILQQELSSVLTVTIKRLVTSELNNLTEKVAGFQDTICFLSRQYEDIKSSLEEKDIAIVNLKKR
ncbi:unnamed protein product [Pieris macdunnoughi]|uniref:Uncharacterized protein n=1 Tax=Pieris macdunnoughi TaxID=345717 RepID=A0A821XBY6_9NEOP|nr:unnamed protein product [Pieris macdunnoughi]